MDYLQEIEKLIPVVLAIGDKYVTNKLGKITEIGSQSVDEIVTESDLNISQGILDAVRTNFPLSFTEEILKSDAARSKEERKKIGHRWVIDPIDGTLELMARNQEIKNELTPAQGCSVRGGSGMILGLLDTQNNPVAMIGYVPETRTLVYATLNEGPFVRVEGKSMALAEPSDKIIGVQRTVVRLRRLQDFYEFLSERTGKELRIIEGGGPGAMAPRLLLEGANVYIDSIANNWKEWDTIGVHILAKRMKGEISDLSGSPLKYNQEDPRKNYGMALTLPGAINHSLLIGLLDDFSHKYGKPLLEPDKRDGISVYDYYRECVTNPHFFV